MIIYITRDDNPEGGYFAFGPDKPDTNFISKTIVEIRAYEDEDGLWDKWYNGKLETGIDGTLDYILAPLWKDGQTVWINTERNING